MLLHTFDNMMQAFDVTVYKQSAKTQIEQPNTACDSSQLIIHMWGNEFSFSLAFTGSHGLSIMLLWE